MRATWILLPLVLAAVLATGTGRAATPASAGTARANEEGVRCTTIDVDGIKVFYRESGQPSLPMLVLLHGNPSSSFMFRDLMPRLSQHFHVIAPDYPGFGYSDVPPTEQYPYTFDHLAQTIDAFLNKLGARRYILYMQDYGGPVGFRIATAHPDRVEGIVIQNANAYEEGLAPEWKAELDKQRQEATTRKEPVVARHKPTSAFAENVKWTRSMYVTGARDPLIMTPDGYTFDAAMLSRPGQDDVQNALSSNYYTNVDMYPVWQQWMRTQKPRALIVWGQGDRIFAAPAAKAYQRDLPQAKLVFFNGGHFLLEEYAPDVAKEIIQTFSASRQSHP